MSVKEADGFTFLRVVVARPLVDADALAEAIGAFSVAVGDRPNRLTFGKTRAFKDKTLRALLVDDSVHHFAWWTLDESRTAGGETVGVNGRLYLREDAAAADFTDRWSGLVVPGTHHVVEILRFCEKLDQLFGIVGGGLGWYPTRAYAAKEIFHGGVYGEWDDETVKRVEGDNLRWRQTRTKLPRLYPFTIIGPDIWADLPPMPTFDPMPVVEDLGMCKLVRTWPTLCEPRDSLFLAGTRSLREWLWPYTIRNPVDHVDSDPPRTATPSST